MPNRPVAATRPDARRPIIYAVGTPDPTQPPGPGADVTAPELGSLSFKPRRFLVGKALPGLLSAAARRTTISFELSEAARVRFRFERAAKGRRAGGRCRKPTRRNRGGRPCTRYVKVKGGFTVEAADGTNRVRFAGRISRRRKLGPGGYRAVALATDEGGNTSKPKRAGFKVLRAKRKKRR